MNGMRKNGTVHSISRVSQALVFAKKIFGLVTLQNGYTVKFVHYVFKLNSSLSQIAVLKRTSLIVRRLLLLKIE